MEDCSRQISDVEFIGQDEVGFYRLSPHSAITIEDALAHQAYHRKAVFSYVLALNDSLEVIGVLATNSPKPFYFKIGAKIEITSTDGKLQVLVDGRPEGLIRSVDLHLSANKLHTITIKRLNLDSKVWKPK